MSRRFSGKDVDVTLPSGKLTLFDQVNVNVASGAAAVTSGGYPAGWVYGEVTGDGDIQLDTEELNKLMLEAETAGSWEEMEAMDITLFSRSGTDELRVELFGVKLDFPDFPVDRKGGEKMTHTIKFLITGEDFVHVNGVPLARKLS